jgi:hypothetical protein
VGEEGGDIQRGFHVDMSGGTQISMGSKLFAAVLDLALTATALGQPAIVTQPQDQAVPVGGTTTMFVQAHEAQSVGYQWFFNSTNRMDNATNATLVISNAIPTQAGEYHVQLSQAGEVVTSQAARVRIFPASLAPFGRITVAPAFELNGVGTDVDSIAFWEAPEAAQTLMFVTGKGNDVVEVWQHPFQGNERKPLTFRANVNGVAVDQETDLLYVADRVVSVFGLPTLQLQRTFGRGIIGVGENNIDILKQSDGRTIIYVSEDHKIHRFAGDVQATYLGSFTPAVSSIETVLADDFHQVIFVPEEQGPAGRPGLHAYQPGGAPLLRNGTNVFGSSGIFDSDEEGILLYTFPSDGTYDHGSGFIVVADQRSDLTDFEFFDRQTWAHLGTLRIEGVSNTDGIASTQQAMPKYPLGLFAAINNDRTTVGLGWDVIFRAVGFQPLPRALRVTPQGNVVTRGRDVVLSIEFSEVMTGFNEAADLRIAHFGTSHTGVVIKGGGARYQAIVRDVGGEGYLLVAVNTASDVRNGRGEPLVSSVTSVPVFIRSPYQAWADQRGLHPGRDQEPSADPDQDQISNFEEFATDRDPLNRDEAMKERVGMRQLDGARYLTYTVPVRMGAVFSGSGELAATVDEVSYSMSGGFDLPHFVQPVREMATPPPVDLPPPNEGWTYRTFGLLQPLATPAAGFIRRKIWQVEAVARWGMERAASE